MRLADHLTQQQHLPGQGLLCQFVAGEILRLGIGEISRRANLAHAQWQLHPKHSDWCWSDPANNGVVHSAHGDPRGMSSNIQLAEAT